jgi:hypothetical protein
MPFLQVTDDAARKAHEAALQRSGKLIPLPPPQTPLQQRHAEAIAQTNKLCKLYPTVVSIFDIGFVIAEMEADQIDHAAHGDIAECIVLNRTIARLKALLPKH